MVNQINKTGGKGLGYKNVQWTIANWKGKQIPPQENKQTKQAE